MIIPRHSYEGQSNDLVSLGHVAHLLTSVNANEEIIYQLTRQLLARSFREALISASVTWTSAFNGLDEGTYFNDLRGLGIKLHPGAARAFVEAGFDITGLQ